MEVLGIITARSGSESIKNKSIALCAGRPLIEYTIEAAKGSKRISRLIISTDSEEYADIARKNGVEVPFLRPAELAKNDTPDLPVFVHALGFLEQSEGYIPDAVVHLRPTTPLKSAKDIDAAVEILSLNSDATSVRSVCEPMHTPFKMYRSDEKYLSPILAKDYPDVFEKYPEAFNMPRQVLPKVWRHSGYVDVIRTETITEMNSMSGGKILPFEFESWRDVDIDTPKELEMAEQIIYLAQKEGKSIWQ